MKICGRLSEYTNASSHCRDRSVHYISLLDSYTICFDKVTDISRKQVLVVLGINRGFYVRPGVILADFALFNFNDYVHITAWSL